MRQSGSETRSDFPGVMEHVRGWVWNWTQVQVFLCERKTVYCREKHWWNFPKAWKRAGKWEAFEQRLGGHLSGTVEMGELGNWIGSLLCIPDYFSAPCNATCIYLRPVPTLGFLWFFLLECDLINIGIDLFTGGIFFEQVFWFFCNECTFILWF